LRQIYSVLRGAHRNHGYVTPIPGQSTVSRIPGCLARSLCVLTSISQLRKRRARRWPWGISSRILVCVPFARDGNRGKLTLNIALGSWADEMEDMPLPSKSTAHGAIRILHTNAQSSYSLYVLPTDHCIPFSTRSYD